MKNNPSIFYIIHGLSLACFSKLTPFIFNFSQGMVETMYSSALGTSNIAKSMETLGNNSIEFISNCGVITGIVVAVFGVIGLFLDLLVPDKSFDQTTVANSKKETPIVLNVEEEIEICDIQDDVLNKKINLLLEDINKLLIVDAIEKNHENKILLENTKNIYLPKIIKQYINTPINLRKVISEKEISAYDMVNKQLDIIIEGISEIEKSLVTDKYHEMKVMERFLKNKFENNTSENIEIKKVEKELNM